MKQLFPAAGWASLILAVMIMAAFWVKGRTSGQNGARAAAAIVRMTQEQKYVPRVVHINIGESVEWQNISTTLGHTVTADPAKATQRENAVLPPGAQPFDSGNIRPGEKFRHTFTIPGIYRYFCIPHEAAGMVGEIEVRPQSIGSAGRG